MARIGFPSLMHAQIYDIDDNDDDNNADYVMMLMITS